MSDQGIIQGVQELDYFYGVWWRDAAGVEKIFPMFAQRVQALDAELLLVIQIDVRRLEMRSERLIRQARGYYGNLLLCFEFDRTTGRVSVRPVVVCKWSKQLIFEMDEFRISLDERWILQPELVGKRVTADQVLFRFGLDWGRFCKLVTRAMRELCPIDVADANIAVKALQRLQRSVQPEQVASTPTRLPVEMGNAKEQDRQFQRFERKPRRT